jgi:uncharacterized protein (TIGR02284 family)
MTMTLDPTLLEISVATLQALAGQCRQAEAGLRSSAAQAQAEDVRALLRRRAEEYKAQAEELQAHVRRLDGQAPLAAIGSPGLWAVAHTVQASHRDLALLEACEGAEDAALERYAEALAAPLEPAAREAIGQQRLQMQQQHELLRAMRDRLRGL